MKGRLEVGKGSNLGRNKGKSRIRSLPWISPVREEKGREARERQQTVTHLGRWAWPALRCSAWEAERQGEGEPQGPAGVSSYRMVRRAYLMLPIPLPNQELRSRIQGSEKWERFAVALGKNENMG